MQYFRCLHRYPIAPHQRILTHSLQWGILGENLGLPLYGLLVKLGVAGSIPQSTNCNRIRNTPSHIHGAQSNLSALKQIGCITSNGVLRASFVCKVGTIGFLLETYLLVSVAVNFNYQSPFLCALIK